MKIGLLVSLPFVSHHVIFGLSRLYEQLTKQNHQRSASLAVSASDDCTARLWDARVRGEVGCFEDEYQITAVAYANDGQLVYTGGIDNCITAWDVRKMHRWMTMKGHTGELALVCKNRLNF